MKLSPKILLVVLFVIASASILDENDTYYEPTFSEIYDQALLEEKQREEVKEVKEEKQEIKIPQKKAKKKARVVKQPEPIVQTSQPQPDYPPTPQPQSPQPQQSQDYPSQPPTSTPSSTPSSFITAKKLPAHSHRWPLFATIYLFGSLAVAIIGFNNHPIIILQGYIIYLFLVFTMTQSRGYITNTYPLQELPTVYLEYTKSPPYWNFKIECYHYRKTKKGKSRVTSYEKEEKWYPRKWENMNGELLPLRDPSDHVFVEFEKVKKVEGKAKKNLQKAWAEFLLLNTKDTYQDKTQEYQVENFNGQVGFVADDAKPFSKIWATVFSIVGMDYPYNLYVEWYVSRYKIKIKKLIKE